jgi:glycosyltransferase involved in cell wall biosynthesis
MNIVFIAPFGFSPKATVSARMLPMATALRRRGHTVTILMPPYDNPKDSGRTWEHEGVQLENMKAQHRSSPRLLWDMAQQLAQRTRDLKPDVAHVFKPIGVGALAMQLGLGRANVVLDNDDWEGAGGWADVNPYSPAQRRFFIWQEARCLQKAPAVTCASETLVDRTAQLRNSREHIHLFPNGPDEMMRAQVAAAQEKREVLRDEFGWRGPVVIYAGTVPLNHDLDVVVHSIQDLTRSDQPDDLKWVIIATGGGIPSLKQRIADAGIAERVEWHGFMPHDRLVDYLVAADVAVYPYRDTPINRAKCSGKVMDYMACGLPMVVSDVGMNRVYLEDGVSGLLTPAGDAAAFGAAMRRLLDDRTFSTSIGKAAHERIWQQFGWDERVPALESVYRADW